MEMGQRTSVGWPSWAAVMVVGLCVAGCPGAEQTRDVGGPSGDDGGMQRDDTGTPGEDTGMDDRDTGPPPPEDTGTGGEDTSDEQDTSDEMDTATDPDTGSGGDDTGTPEDTGTPGPDASYEEKCPNGPYDKPPDPSCAPSPVPDTGNKYADCVARINQFRLECLCLPPLERWKSAESCADRMAKYDAMKGQAHAGFKAGVCSPRGYAQNECPGYRGGVSQVLGTCLQQMWDEGDDPGGENGHYEHMSSTRFSKVACGFYDGGGGMWAVQNFR